MDLQAYEDKLAPTVALNKNFNQIKKAQIKQMRYQAQIMKSQPPIMTAISSIESQSDDCTP